MGKLKSAKEILESMGFRKDSPESTQLAFFRHLKNNASQQPPLEPPSALPEQLEFDLLDDGPKSWSSTVSSKKVSNQ